MFPSKKIIIFGEIGWVGHEKKNLKYECLLMKAVIFIPLKTGRISPF